MSSSLLRAGLLAVVLGMSIGVANADGDADTVSLFKHAGKSARFFATSYGYAVFPDIGKGGLGVGAAYGRGRVYARGRLIGRTTVTQLSVGFQAGGQDYSQIIFFRDKSALDDFIAGNFEFGADAVATAVTVSASASAGTTGGPEATASAGMNAATTAGEYRKGVAVFTIAKGGLMYEAAIAGQKFSFQPLGSKATQGTP